MSQTSEERRRTEGVEWFGTSFALDAQDGEALLVYER
jgi:hypothetical protein